MKTYKEDIADRRVKVERLRHEKGLSAAKIAEQLGVTSRTIERDLAVLREEKNIKLQHPGEMRILMGLVDKKLSGSQLRIAILLASNKDGLSVEEISRKTRIPLSSVYRALKPVKGIEIFHSTDENTFILKFENGDSRNRE